MWFRSWIIKRLGLTLDDFLDGATEDETREILTRATETLFNTVSADDIFRLSPDGTVMFEGRPMMTAEAEVLKKEAELLRTSKLFRVLDREVKYHTNLKMREATTLQQLDAAKMLEFAWDILKTKLKRL